MIIFEVQTKYAREVTLRSFFVYHPTVALTLHPNLKRITIRAKFLADAASEPKKNPQMHQHPSYREMTKIQPNRTHKATKAMASQNMALSLGSE